MFCLSLRLTIILIFISANTRLLGSLFLENWRVKIKTNMHMFYFLNVSFDEMKFSRTLQILFRILSGSSNILKLLDSFMLITWPTRIKQLISCENICRMQKWFLRAVARQPTPMKSRFFFLIQILFYETFHLHAAACF
jgi:hypothetical protein